MLYSEATNSDVLQTTNCLDYFTSCFKSNYRNQGQCCQCNYGWAGIDCNTPVCNPPCIFGTCVGPDTCICEKGWQGAICALGICSNCKYGVCSAPETCICFYGYEGAACDIPTSDPPCQHGYPIAPNVCQCDLGWNGPICDVPYCPQGCGFGYCVDGQVCECQHGYFTTQTLTSECDAIDCKIYHPKCLKCNFTHCLECDTHYVLDAKSLTCKSCKDLFEPLCLNCDSQVCKECFWPYKYNTTLKRCFSSGMLEFALPRIIINETVYNYTVIVRRLYETYGAVSVDFELQNTHPQFTRLEDSRGTLVFGDGVEEQSITFRVFKRQYYEPDDTLTTFKFELFNPSTNTELATNSKQVIYYFDDEVLLTDAAATQCKLNGTIANTQAAIPVVVGWTNTFVVASHLDYGLKKTIGNDLYIVRFLYRNATEAEVLKSYHVAQEIYHFDFITRSLDIAVAKIYVTTPGLTMYYYDNTGFYSVPFISRIEAHLPFMFTNEMRRMSYFSLRMECALIFNYSSSPEDVTFFVALANEASARIWFGTELVFETEPYQCFGVYYSSADRCCQAMKSFVVRQIDLNGTVPYYMRIEYRNKDSKPCIRMLRQSVQLESGDLSVDSYALTELKVSPFFLQPITNLEIVAMNMTTLDIPPFVDSNTKEYADYLTLQATLSNLLIIHPRDIYGNIITEIDSLEFTASINDSVNLFTNKSFFHHVLKRYEIFLTPIVSTSHGVLTIECQGQNISGSPFNVTIVPGPYSLQNSSFIEWNGDGVSPCIVNNTCSIQITLNDTNLNHVIVPQLFTNIDVDVQMRGPYFSYRGPPANLYISKINNTLSSHALYYIQYTRYMVGQYWIYIRLRNEKAPKYYIPINVTTVIGDPNSTLILPSEYGEQVAGINFTYQVQVFDAFENYVETGLANLTVVYVNQNVSIANVSHDFQLYIEKGIYNVSSTLYVRGFYLFYIYLNNTVTNSQDLIKGCPFNLTLQPNEPTANFSLATGSGINEALLGRVQDVYLQVRDIYGNQYNQSTFRNLSVFNLTVICNDTDVIPINLTDSDPFHGKYHFVYRIVKFYKYAAVTVQVLSQNMSTFVYEYQHVNGSIFNVSVIVLDNELYNSYADLSLTGFGVSALSSIFLIPNVVLAGESFQIQVYPVNIQGVNFVYFEQDADYFMVEFTPLQDPTGSLNETWCNCRPQFQRYCSFFSYAKAACLMLPACMWVHDGSSTMPNRQSCVPCSQGCTGNNAQGLLQLSYDPRMSNYSLYQFSDSTYYYFNAVLPVASHHLLTIAAFRIGLLTVTLYDNSDFTDMAYTFYIPLLKTTFNPSKHVFFKDRTKEYSLTIQGMIRFDYSTLYNVTVYSNKEVQIILDGELVLFKPHAEVESASFLKEVVKHRLYMIEILIRERARVPDLTQLGYFNMTEQCGHTKERLWVPRNMFQFQHIDGSDTTKIKVDAGKFIGHHILAYANLPMSDVYEKDGQISAFRHGGTFRAGITMNFVVVVRDRVSNEIVSPNIVQKLARDWLL